MSEDGLSIEGLDDRHHATNLSVDQFIPWQFAQIAPINGKDRVVFMPQEVRHAIRAALSHPPQPADGEAAVRQAFQVLKAAIQADHAYAWSWHCNIAMSAKDEGFDHANANRGAARFMSTCFDVDVTQFDEWKSLNFAPPPPMGGEPVGEVIDANAGCNMLTERRIPKWRDAPPPVGTKLYTRPAAPTPSAPAAVGEWERWLVEEVGENGNSTGRYMLDQTDLTITDDPNKARGFLRRRTAQFRAEDMREKHGTAWRTAQHVFIAAAPQAQEGGQR